MKMALLLILLFTFHVADACTRVLHVFKDNLVVTARSMDWYVRYPTTIWKFPRGLSREGLTPNNPAQWISKYGSVVIVQTAEGNQSATADGLNEKGLVANLLYLTETDYGKRKPEIPGVASSIYLQFILDNFASVKGVVEYLKEDNIQIAPVPIPNSEHLPTMHVSVSDSSGDSAVIEFLDGKLVIHHSRDYQVMANSPVFERQLAMNAYWEEVGGHKFLPGTRNSADRFVRASFYNTALPEPKDYREAIAGVMSIVRNVSSPYGRPDPQKPNISTTMWRAVADQTNLTYYYESTISPNVIWTDLRKMDFSMGSGAQALEISDKSDFHGEVNRFFEKRKPLEFARVPK
jgi:choloylglycine hydrolase